MIAAKLRIIHEFSKKTEKKYLKFGIIRKMLYLCPRQM